MPYTRTKICGITSVDDALAAVRAGADAIGLVFYEPSARCVTIEQAAAICTAVGPFVTTVGLFVDAGADAIYQTLRQVPLHVLQFHGMETAAFCSSFSRPYIKALRMSPGLDLAAAIEPFVVANAQGILLDSYHPGKAGGTGEAFDWRTVPVAHRLPLILAGGLHPENVSRAVLQVRPYAVDVSSGVEFQPGSKDSARINAFIQAVRQADNQAG